MELKINYTLTAPLSHIGTTSSIDSLFQTVLTKEGKIPVVTANSVRGQIRDAGAKYLLDALKTKVDKEVFHALFSGGNLSGTMKNDIEKARKAREKFPLISLLGGGLGDIILAGKMLCTFAYPICRETADITGVYSDISWHKLIEDIEFTRTDDSKNDELTGYITDAAAETAAKASTQMRYSVQYLAAGTQLVQKLHLLNATDIEYGALLSAIREWWNTPTLGGMAAKGFGYFDAELSGAGLSVTDGVLKSEGDAGYFIGAYDRFLAETEITPFFNLLKGGAKSGKKADKPAESDGETD